MFERPEVAVLAVVSTVAGVAACVWLLPPDFSLLSRIGAGLALGFATTTVLFANRMIGGSDFE